MKTAGSIIGLACCSALLVWLGASVHQGVEADRSAELPLAPMNNSRETTKATSEPEPGPSFDVVRVEPNGELVIAGRSLPRASVELLRNGEPYARIVADGSGMFAILAAPLAIGSHELVLEATRNDGSRVRSPVVATVVVAADLSSAPLVALTTSDKPSIIISNPDQGPSIAVANTTGARPAPHTPAVRITAVEAQEGRIFVSGEAARGVTLRLYVNETFVAEGVSNADGRVSFVILKGMAAGGYRVRLDEVSQGFGNVVSRAEVSFTVPVLNTASVTSPENLKVMAAQQSGLTTGRVQIAAKASPPTSPGDPGIITVPEINTAIVSRGENLWRISRRVYGHGTRYSVIYGANQPQIRNPDLIFPGQVFVLPSTNEPPAPNMVARPGQMPDRS